MSLRWPWLAAGLLLGGLAYFSLTSPSRPPETAPAPAVHPTVEVPPVTPLLLQAKVRTLLEQRKKLLLATSRGDVQPAQVRLRAAAYDIREWLLREGIHSEAEVIRWVRLASKQAGHNDQQTAAVVDAFFSRGFSPVEVEGGLSESLRKAMPAQGGVKD